MIRGCAIGIAICWCLSASSQEIGYSDLLANPQSNHKEIWAGKNQLDLELNQDGVLDYLRLIASKPYPVIEVHVSSPDGHVKRFEGSGYLHRLVTSEETTDFLIIRPACCCLEERTIQSIRFFNDSSEPKISEYHLHQDVLLPSPDIVFEATKTKLKGRFQLYKAPFYSEKKVISACTGEESTGTALQAIDSDAVRVLFESGKWNLSEFRLNSDNEKTEHWMIGWHRQE